MPGSGDSVQALKAGIMEIPDVIAINKKDHPAAKTMLNEVRSILSLDLDRDWQTPIVLTEALTGENVDVLWERIGEHRAFLEPEGHLEERRRRNLAGEVFAVASGRAKAHLEQAVESDPELRRLLDEVQRRELDPLTAVREILEKVFKLDDDEPRRRSLTSRPRVTASAASRRSRPSSPPRRSPGARPRVLLKAECLQRTGSFKIRGAVNRLSVLSEAERAAGVVAASAGNHGQAVAWAARRIGVTATVFMPEDAPMAKVDATRSYGARSSWPARTWRSPSRPPRPRSPRPAPRSSTPSTTQLVIAGQGTLGLELAEQAAGGRHGDRARGRRRVRVRDRDCARRPAPADAHRRSPGRVVRAARRRRPARSTIADGIAVKRPGALTARSSASCRRLVPRQRRGISEAIVLLLERMKLVVEGAGAVGLAALLAGRVEGDGPVVIVLSGGNVDASTLLTVMRHGLTRGGRYLVVRSRIPDRPG